MSRAGFALRATTRGKPPRQHPYVATLDGAVILGMAFRTREEAIAFAERVAAVDRPIRNRRTIAARIRDKRS